MKEEKRSSALRSGKELRRMPSVKRVMLEMNAFLTVYSRALKSVSVPVAVEGNEKTD